jgi:hypothetical protein
MSSSSLIASSKVPHGENREEQSQTSKQELLHSELILLDFDLIRFLLIFGRPAIYCVSISMVDFGFLMGFDFGFYSISMVDFDFGFYFCG